MIKSATEQIKKVGSKNRNVLCIYQTKKKLLIHKGTLCFISVQDCLLLCIYGKFDGSKLHTIYANAYIYKISKIEYLL